MSDNQNVWVDRTLIEYRAGFLPVQELTNAVEILTSHQITITASFCGFDLNAKIAIPPRLNITKENLSSFLASFGLQKHFDLTTAVSYLHNNHIIIHNPTPSLISWKLSEPQSYLTWRYNEDSNEFTVIGYAALPNSLQELLSINPNSEGLHNPFDVNDIENLTIRMQDHGLLPKEE